jgi:hypothetical protein
MVGKGPIVSVVLLAVAACLFEPGEVMTGQWGGRGISLDARNAEVQLLFAPCISAASPELRVDANGHFEGTAHSTDARNSFGLTSIHMSGAVQGDAMAMAVIYTFSNVTFSNGTHSEAVSFTLLRSAAPDFSGMACLK